MGALMPSDRWFGQPPFDPDEGGCEVFRLGSGEGVRRLLAGDWPSRGCRDEYVAGSPVGGQLVAILWLPCGGGCVRSVPCRSDFLLVYLGVGVGVGPGSRIVLSPLGLLD